MLKRVLVCFAFASLLVAVVAPAVAAAAPPEWPPAYVCNSASQWADATLRTSEADGGWTEMYVNISDADGRAISGGIIQSSSVGFSDYVRIARCYPATAASPQRIVVGAGWLEPMSTPTPYERLSSASVSFTVPLTFIEYAGGEWVDGDVWGGSYVRSWQGGDVTVDAQWTAVGDVTRDHGRQGFRDSRYMENMVQWSVAVPADATLTVIGDDGTHYADMAAAAGGIGYCGYRDVSFWHFKPEVVER